MVGGPAIQWVTRWSLRAGLSVVEGCFETASRHTADEGRPSWGLFAQASRQTWVVLLPERMPPRRPVACRPWRISGCWSPAAMEAAGRGLVWPALASDDGVAAGGMGGGNGGRGCAGRRRLRAAARIPVARAGTSARGSEQCPAVIMFQAQQDSMQSYHIFSHHA